MLETKSSISKMFKEAFGVDYTTMKIDKKINVGSFNCDIQSFNHKKNIKEFKKVNYIIRKKDSIKYITKLIGGTTLNTSGDHKFFVKLFVDKEPYYEEVRTLVEMESPIYLLNKDESWEKIEDIILSKDIIPILDLEVEGNNNYYSNGILSHNTMFGNPWVTSGGNALKFYASIRAEIYRGKKQNDKEGNVVSNRGKIKIVKNKTYPPYKECEFDIEFGVGISKTSEIIDFGVDYGIIEKKGSWYYYNDTTLGQGKDKAKALLEDNPELMEELHKKIIKKYEE